MLWALAVVANYGGVLCLHWLPGRGETHGPRAHRDLGSAHHRALSAVLHHRPRRDRADDGAAFVGEPFKFERLLALAICFTGTVALWWCYFQRAEAIGIEAAESAEGAGAVGYWGTWTLTLTVLALVGIAVGDELAIAHPSDDATLGFSILTFGGPALFLLAQVLFQREALGQLSPSRLLGLVALAILAIATAPLTMMAASADRLLDHPAADADLA